MAEPCVPDAAPVDRSAFMLSNLYVLQSGDETMFAGASATRVPP
jgi:hypothetical protein